LSSQGTDDAARKFRVVFWPTRDAENISAAKCFLAVRKLFAMRQKKIPRADDRN
jgi:hypothetical protein